MARIAVVGAGLAGLSAAIRLADFGHDVVVLEAGERVGGQVIPSSPPHNDAASPPAASLISTFTLPAVLRDLFRKTGRPIEKCLELVPSESARSFVTSDGTSLTLPNADRGGTIDVLDGQFAPGTGKQWDDMIFAAGRLWSDLRPGFERPFRRKTARSALAGRGARRARRGSTATHGTLRQFVHDHLVDPRSRQLLYSYAHRVGTDPSRAPAAVAVLAYLDQTFGVWTVGGGFGVLIDALRDRTIEKGADVRLRTAAQEIEVRNGQVRAVTTDNETFPADIVVSSAPPSRTNDLLRATSARKREITGTPPTRSAFSLIVNGSPVADQVTILNDELPATVCSLEGDLLAIHVPCDPHGDGQGDTDWRDAANLDAFSDRVLQLVGSHEVGVAASARPVMVRTPYDLQRSIGAPGGRVYGSSWLVTGDPSAAPSTRAQVGGLLLAGGSVHPGPNVPFSIMSGGIAADVIGRA